MSSKSLVKIGIFFHNLCFYFYFDNGSVHAGIKYDQKSKLDGCKCVNKKLLLGFPGRLKMSQ
jgi:hypothetical protein